MAEEINIGGNTITEIQLGNIVITEGWVGSNQVFSSAIRVLTLTLSETIANAFIGDSNGNVLSSVMISSEESTTVYLTPNSGYEYATFPSGQVSTGTNFTSQLGSLSGGRLPITLTANALTADVSETATFGFSAPTAKQITVTLNRDDNISGSNHTTVVGTSSTGAFGTSYTFTDQSISPAAGYYFTSGPTWSGASLTGTYPAVNTTITRTVTGATALETISLGNINSTFDWDGESLGFSISQTGPSTPVVTSKPSWITINTLTPTTTQGVATASANNSASSRSGTVVISKGSGSASDSFSVSQQAQPDTINITSSSVNPGANTQVLNLVVNSSGPSSITCEDNVSWITSCSVSGTTLTINMEVNTGAERTGTVTVTKGSATDSVTVTQAAGSLCEITGEGYFTYNGTNYGGQSVGNSITNPRVINISNAAGSATAGVNISGSCTPTFDLTEYGDSVAEFGVANAVVTDDATGTVTWPAPITASGNFFCYFTATTTNDSETTYFQFVW